MRAGTTLGAMTDAPTIRPAGDADAGRIGEIYDEGVAEGNATFATGPHTADERRAWLAARGERAPVFCAERGGEVVAWSALAPFSHRPWFDGVAEYTVYVAQSARGTGVGRAMLRHLIDQAPGFGYWKLVGVIMAENASGLALAERNGFRMVGTYRGHGRLDGAWRDVSMVELHLAGGGGR